MKSKKKKTWTYSPFHSFKVGDKEASMASQLYQTGIYIILNNDPALQFGSYPQNMMNMEKKLNKDFKEGKITDLVLSTPIKVAEDENGFYIQIS